MESVYYDLERIDEIIAREGHRDIIGGRWEELGDLQLKFMKEVGLRSRHKLLDLGCGSLRAGVHFIRYLESGHYFGVDISDSLLDAGYNVELREAGLTSRLPRDNLVCNSEFESGAPKNFFDFVIAQSLFTHLGLSTIRTCLGKVARVVRQGGLFYATILRLPNDADVDDPFLHAESGLTSYRSSDPYHQRYADLEAAAMPHWDTRLIGKWGHPGGNEMVEFTRL